MADTPEESPPSAAGGAPSSRPTDAAIPSDGDDEPAERTDGGVTTHTIRLELADEPGELLSALQPIADNGGNLLSIFHERGNRTPSGRIPVEVDLSCPPDRFEGILSDLRTAGVNVVQADAERYADEVTVLLVGDLLETGVSDALRSIEREEAARVAGVTLETAESGPASARLRLRAREGRLEAALGAVRSVAADRGLNVIEPLEVGR